MTTDTEEIMDVVIAEQRAVAAVPQGAVTPMALLQMAMAQGADLQKLEKLMELQERWEANEARKAFTEALSAFKENPPELTKNKQVGFDTSKGRTEYRHATLDQVSLKIGQALSEHGLSHRWDVRQDNGQVTVTCVLTHRQGHSESVTMSGLPDTSGTKNGIQAVGSTVTYLQRYTLLAATGMAVKDQDNDGAGPNGAMPDGVRADFESAIDALTDKDASAALWKDIVAACKRYGDKPAYDALKDRISEKSKAFKKEAA